LNPLVASTVTAAIPAEAVMANVVKTVRMIEFMMVGLLMIGFFWGVSLFEYPCPPL